MYLNVSYVLAEDLLVIMVLFNLINCHMILKNVFQCKAFKQFMHNVFLKFFLQFLVILYFVFKLFYCCLLRLILYIFLEPVFFLMTLSF